MTTESEDILKTDTLIIGGGITGLSLAAHLDQKSLSFALLEKKERVGGQIQTLKKDGFVFEIGPNTGSISNPEVVELFEYAAPDAELEIANPAAKHRWIWKGHRFHPLPSGLVGGIKTPLFRWQDKLSILLEPFRKKGTDPYETIGALAERRLGRSFVEYAVDPFLGGIYAGDPYTLTTKYALPKLYNLEQEYGSFIRGSIKKSAQKKSDRDKKATKEVFSAVGGLQNLVDAIEKKIQRSGSLITSIRDITIRQAGVHIWHTTYRDASGIEHTIESKYVVTTVRSDLLAPMLPEDIATQLTPIESLVYAPMIEVCVGFDHLPGVPRNAFGGLVPSLERRKVLGILFPSSCFKGRTPHSDGALFTLFMGGLRDSHYFDGMSDNEVIAIGLDELYDMMHIPYEKKPDMVHLTRYAKAIPQYDRHSKERLERVARIEAEHPGLFLAGGLRDGIGLAARIAQGAAIARTIASETKKQQEFHPFHPPTA